MKNKKNNQKVLNFSYKNNYIYKDIFKSSWNEIAIEMIEKWPDWPSDNRIICIYGPAGSGKTHLSNIWMQKSKAITYNEINHLSLDNIYSINKYLLSLKNFKT